ncbi:BPI fold-containing family B member 3-like isoform X3 [Podarcis raffonei]|uniref:BPI fold-containing family B member 3-like isoform X3 n=1 Tax=Podarcis raffonei TaxID=65483 RepID=UPI0023297658|nr:BPI fold-containing family B member 3-like isoform X3 [Podarcis raffonei]
MLKAWTVLLLCGLLPSTQALTDDVLSMARLHKDVLENGISDTLAKGNLLQGLLGQVLGGDLLGEILGGQGGGPLGLVGGLAGGALGGQGGGPLGLVGGLAGGALGGQGGGPLGLVGGLAGGALGGQGGGPLGLVGGLAGGVLGGQGGGPLGIVGGALGGKGGLLGGVLGREGLLGLKLVDVVLPKVSLKFLKGIGVGLNIYTKVALKGDTLLGGLLNLLVEVNITANARLVQDKSGTPILVVENCKTNLGNIQILSGFLPLNLDRVLTNLLSNVLPGVLCPVVDLVLNIVNTLLGTVNSVCPFGTLGKLHYTLAGLPWFSDEQQIVLNLNVLVLDNEGNSIKLPPSKLPSLPPAGDQTSQLLLSGDLISSLLQLVMKNGQLNVDITDQALRGAVPLTTSALQSVLPQLSRLLPTSLPLVVKIRISDLPGVSLQNGKLTVTLAAAVDVFALADSGPELLFGLNAQIDLSGSVRISGAKLAVSLSLDNVSLNVSSSQIGSFDVAVLKTWITNLLRIGYLPVINGALEIGIPLPNLFNLNFAAGDVNIVDNALLASVTPKLL